MNSDNVINLKMQSFISERNRYLHLFLLCLYKEVAFVFDNGKGCDP